MKLSFARKEDEALLFTASSSSSSFTEGSGGGYGVLAIGLCDVAGAGVRALKSLTASSKSGKQLKRRDFELKFTDENGGDLVGKMIGNNNGENLEADEEEEEEEEDDISALERAIFVKTSDDGEALDDAPAVSLVQFTDDAEENNAVVLSCLAINVMVPERDEASACHAVVWFVREHLENCARKIVFCAAMKLERGVMRGDAEKDVFCFGDSETVENEKLTRLDEKATRVRDGLLKGLISGSRCAFGSENVSGIVVPGFAVPRVGGSEMEMESGETANRLERIVGETFKGLGVSASGNAKNFRATKTWWKTKEGAKFMSSMFM
ncbi:unnamed protein product [Bathycoccus prasinos]|jgi:hypothetical protein|tara:strand:- start:1868 stop:2836 length:969 start_codon:yes stop_codon:yes gene_type:complete